QRARARGDRPQARQVHGGRRRGGVRLDVHRRRIPALCRLGALDLAGRRAPVQGRRGEEAGRVPPRPGAHRRDARRHRPPGRKGAAGLGDRARGARPGVVNPEPFFAVLDCIESYAAHLEAIGAAHGSHRPPAPRWDQDWFPRLDAAAAYALVRKEPPQRIVEVGSGHSTRFLARAVADGGLATRITAIDPEPRASLAGLDVEWLRIPVERVKPFPRLEAGDILFIDSSHQLKPGNDVEFLLSTVIPRLPPGVRVHFHDIFLPDGYPTEWTW